MNEACGWILYLSRFLPEPPLAVYDNFRFVGLPEGSLRNGAPTSKCPPAGPWRAHAFLIWQWLAVLLLVPCRRWYAGSLLAVTSHLTGKESYFQTEWHRWM